MKNFITGLGVVLLSLFFMAILIALPIMWLWNWLMPDLFNLVEINFWQAIGISTLSGLLFINSSINYNK